MNTEEIKVKKTGEHNINNTNLHRLVHTSKIT